MPESRKFSRLPFNIEAELLFADDTTAIEVHLIDISLKGALVELQGNMEKNKGDLCKLMLHLPGSESVITMETEVRHIEKSHLGLHCVSIDVDSITHLRRLMELNMGDPGLLERELLSLG